MGYYTSYKLSVKHISVDLSEDYIYDIIDELRVPFSDANYALDECGGIYESTKWYDHEADLKEFSGNYPELIFTLHGEGEESGDIWDKHFMHGKMQKCEAVMTIPELDLRLFR